MLTNTEHIFKMDSLKLFKNKKSGYWYVRYSRGHEKSLKTKDRAVAEKAFKKATRKMVEDRLVRIDRENKTTLSEFTKEYLRISGGTKADPTSYPSRRWRSSLKAAAAGTCTRSPANWQPNSSVTSPRQGSATRPSTPTCGASRPP